MVDYLIDDKNPLLNLLMKFEPGERAIPTTSKGGEETALELTLVQRPYGLRCHLTGAVFFIV